MKILTIGEKLGKPECPYLRRWVLNLGLFSIRLHHWLASDDGRNFHDHPWWFITLILKGSYTDVSPQGSEKLTCGNIRWRSSLHRHTVVVPSTGVWTLVLTGPELRKWGFWVNGKFFKRSKYFYEYGHHQCQ